MPHAPLGTFLLQGARIPCVGQRTGVCCRLLGIALHGCVLRFYARPLHASALCSDGFFKQERGTGLMYQEMGTSHWRGHHCVKVPCMKGGMELRVKYARRLISGVRFFMTLKVSPLIIHLLEAKPSHRTLALTF